MHTVTDGLGKEIDQGIFDTVVALNVLGIPTRQSCEGHLEWGTGAPWVDIQAKSIDTHYEFIQSVFARLEAVDMQGGTSSRDREASLVRTQRM